MIGVFDLCCGKIYVVKVGDMHDKWLLLFEIRPLLVKSLSRVFGLFMPHSGRIDGTSVINSLAGAFQLLRILLYSRRFITIEETWSASALVETLW